MKPSSNGLMTGDEVYFRHDEGGIRTGKVKSVGRDGFQAECDGQTHRVRHEHYAGHRSRRKLAVSLVEHGEDGALTKLEDGRHIFINGFKEADMNKAVMLFLKAGPIKGRAGLSLQDVQLKNGGHAKRYVSTAADESGAHQGYGTHNLERNDTVSYEHEGETHTGRITAADDKGAKVRNLHGAEHDIGWDKVRSHFSETVKPLLKPEIRGSQKPIPADTFNAGAYAADHDDGAVSVDSVLGVFPGEVREMIAQVQRRLGNIEETIKVQKVDGHYNADRLAKHAKIAEHFMSAAQIEAATPAPGTPPTFTVLGGRGGSGKSWFKGKVYDPKKSIVLDADEIKGMLPEYEGWNAFQVHEESSDIFDRLTLLAKSLGLNIVHDATMKSGPKAVENVQSFIDAGYRTEAHYMHLPRKEAAKRAIARFVGKTARYVPVNVILSNQRNEENFNQVRGMVNNWSFYDNNVPEGAAPKLISKSGGSADKGKPGDTVAKSYRPVLFFAGGIP